MNGKKARALRKANGPKPTPDYPVVRTRPIIASTGREGGYSTLVGHVGDARNGRVILTEAGSESHPKRLAEDGRTVLANKAHERRVAAVTPAKRGLFRRRAA